VCTAPTPPTSSLAPPERAACLPREFEVPGFWVFRPYRPMAFEPVYPFAVNPRRPRPPDPHSLVCSLPLPFPALPPGAAEPRHLFFLVFNGPFGQISRTRPAFLFFLLLDSSGVDAPFFCCDSRSYCIAGLGRLDAVLWLPSSKSQRGKTLPELRTNLFSFVSHLRS